MNTWQALQLAHYRSDEIDSRARAARTAAAAKDAGPVPPRRRHPGHVRRWAGTVLVSAGVRLLDPVTELALTPRDC
jgi:hypothetical protein